MVIQVKMTIFLLILEIVKMKIKFVNYLLKLYTKKCDISPFFFYFMKYVFFFLRYQRQKTVFISF
jgi:hypothetical protein